MYQAVFQAMATCVEGTNQLQLSTMAYPKSMGEKMELEDKFILVHKNFEIHAEIFPKMNFS